MLYHLIAARSATNMKQAEDKTRIVKLEADLKVAQSSALASSAPADGQAVQTQTAIAPVETSTEISSSEEIDRLKEELALAQKEVEKLRARAEAAEVAANNASTAPQAESQPNAEQLDATRIQLEEREAKVAELEAAVQQRQAILDQREAKIANRESKAQELRDTANNKIRSIRQQTDEEKTKLTAEIDQLKKQISDSATAAPATPKAVASETPVKTESISWPEATQDQIRAWINSNKEAKQVLQMIVNKYKVPLEKEVEALKKRIEELTQELKALKSAEKPSGPADQNAADSRAADLAIAKAEHEANLKTQLEALEGRMSKQAELKVKLTKGQLSALKVKWGVFEKAAKETPTEEVGKVFEEAKNARDTAPAQATAPTAVQVPAGGIPRPASALGQQVPAPAQVNGAPAQPHPLQQAAQNAGATTAPNPFAQAARGTLPPGSANQVQVAVGQQPQQQPTARGLVTAPGALKNVIGAAQSGIPRSGIPQPGSGIPQPGGRGGRGGAQGPAQSGIGRGGAAARGGRGGRGGQSQNNSPRTSLNPGAGPFQPGQSAGRAQKRNADGEADGSGARGNKRPRGGRGGQGGGEGTGSTPAAAE